MVKETKKEAAHKENKPSNAMIALFSGSDIDTSKLVRRNLPQMIKPGDVPLGGTVSGEILKVVNSPVSTVKGKLLWLKHDNGTEFMFPVTGVIRSALAPGIKADDKELQSVLEENVGHLFIAKRTESKQSEKFKKEMFMFEVFTVKQ